MESFHEFGQAQQCGGIKTANVIPLLHSNQDLHHPKRQITDTKCSEIKTVNGIAPPPLPPTNTHTDI